MHVKWCRKKWLPRWTNCKLSLGIRLLDHCIVLTEIYSFKNDPNHPIDKRAIGDVCQVIDVLGGDFRYASSTGIAFWPLIKIQ